MAEGCSANISESNFDSEEEFEGFRNDNISAYSGESDISVDEESESDTHDGECRER